MLKLNKRQHKGVEELWLAMFTRMRTVLGCLLYTSSCILSPLYYLNNNLRSSLIYTENGNGITGIKITGMPLTGIYAVSYTHLDVYKRQDKIMPGYGFAANKGYGSAEHIAAVSYTHLKIRT